MPSHVLIKIYQDNPWRLRALHNTSPVRFQLRTDAFQGISSPQMSADHDAGYIFALNNGALAVTSRDHWNRNLD